jgi:hypothetical protein
MIEKVIDMSERDVKIANNLWNENTVAEIRDKNTVAEIRDKIQNLGLYPNQYVGLVLDVIKIGMIELCDDAIIEYDASAGRAGRAKVTITFERGNIGTIEYYLNARELKKILDGLDDIAACET